MYDTVMHITRLFLDWNGTVMADLDRSHRVTNRLLSDVDKPPLSLNEFREQFRLPMRAFFSAIGVPTQLAESTEHRWSMLSAETPAPLVPGAQRLLEWCQQTGVPVGVVTGALPELVAADCDAHGIGTLIDTVIGPADDKREVLDKLAAGHSSGVMYVGDTVHDVSSARAVGITAVALTTGYTPAERLLDAEPDLSVSNLSELLNHLTAPHSQRPGERRATPVARSAASTARPPHTRWT